MQTVEKALLVVACTSYWRRNVIRLAAIGSNQVCRLGQLAFERQQRRASISR